MPYNPSHDFEADLSYGELGEELARSIFDGTMRVEVKRKRKKDNLFYLEMEQKPRGKDWKPSGLATTEADYFAFVVGNTEVLHFFPTFKLRALVQSGKCKPVATFDSANPTKGYLVSLEQVYEQ